MIWLYILIYFLGAVITWLIVYTLYVKQYIKEQSNLKFNYWVEEYYFDIIFFASYIMIAYSYTFEACIDEEAFIKHWYLALFAIIWCVLIGWFYFPCDLGAKLCKKL